MRISRAEGWWECECGLIDVQEGGDARPGELAADWLPGAQVTYAQVPPN